LSVDVAESGTVVPLDQTVFYAGRL